MFCEGHVSLKEPLKKCKQFSYFAYFSKEPQKISEQFSDLLDVKRFSKNPRRFQVPKWSQG